MAIAAGCDGVLMCAPEPAAQMAALEAVIYAVEKGRLPERRVDDALARQKRVKERFLSLPGQRPQATSLRSVLGRTSTRRSRQRWRDSRSDAEAARARSRRPNCRRCSRQPVRA